MNWLWLDVSRHCQCKPAGESGIGRSAFLAATWSSRASSLPRKAFHRSTCSSIEMPWHCGSKLACEGGIVRSPFSCCQTNRHRGLAVLVRSYRFQHLLLRKHHPNCSRARRFTEVLTQALRCLGIVGASLLAKAALSAAPLAVVRQTAIAASRCSCAPTGFSICSCESVTPIAPARGASPEYLLKH